MLAEAALLLHITDAWVWHVTSKTDLGRRAVLIALIAALGLSLWESERRLEGRASAVIRLATGLFALIVIGPILVSHIDKIGFEGSAVTGSVALGGAAMLVTVGAKSLIQSGRRWRKLLALPIAFLLLQFLVLPLSSAVLVSNAARPPLGDLTPSEMGLSFEEIAITLADGTPLAGWYVPSQNGSAVILRHGSGSTRINTLDHAEFLAAAGYGVLMMDARGHGESEGRINELGWHGVEDIRASLDFLEDQPDVDGRIGGLGLSMGGEELLMAAADDDRIAAVVAEGVGIGNYNDSVANGGHAMARSVNWVQFALVDLLSDAQQPTGIVMSIERLSSRPALLVSGKPVDEASMAEAFERAGGSSVEHWHLNDTPHTDALFVHHEEYTQRVLDLFQRALLGERP